MTENVPTYLGIVLRSLRKTFVENFHEEKLSLRT